MSYARIVNLIGGVLRLGVMVAAASLSAASSVHAAEMEDLVANMPRAYSGEFLWDGDTTVQNVAIRFYSVRALNEENAEAIGCGLYKVGRHVTKIRVQMLVRLSNLQVEILEQSPEGNSFFVIGGSHRGTLSGDLQRIDAQWNTKTVGAQGRLRLSSTPSAACAPEKSL